MASFDARAEPKMQMRSLIGPALFKAPPTRQSSGGTAAAMKAANLFDCLAARRAERR